ncbi:MAG TPA: FAD-binding protein [bacterium]|nr:FAD-binding protein [bacterium]
MMFTDIEEALGKDAVTTAAGRPAAALADEAAARALTALCRERGWRLRPWSGGEPPTGDLPPDAVLVSPGVGLTGEFAVAADDYYCEVPATMTAGELAARLAETPLWLPFATAGGAAAAAGVLVACYPPNAFAPAYGELQRLLFGVSFVNDDGDLVATGRRTIKGVAGYDLSKLFLGSRGRAGLITRVRLRLFPRPRDAVFWRAPGAPADASRGGKAVCSREAGGETFYYADGHTADLDALAEALRGLRPGLVQISRGFEAAADFGVAVGRMPCPKTGEEGPAGPRLSDLYV